MSFQVAFVDTRLVDWQVLVEAFEPGIEVILLDPGRDGIEQIADALAGRTGLDSIHMLSHGSSGTVFLGSTILASDSLHAYASALSAIGASLAEGGNILLYGCNVAAGEQGKDFLQQLALYTGAEVAAADGAGGVAAIQFAFLSSKPALSAADFLIAA